MITVAALYKFTRFDDIASIKIPLLAACEAAGVKGTLLLAGEGINGTIAGAPNSIETVISKIRTLPGCDDMDVKYSHAETMPFFRMKVRLKKEIVTLGVPHIDPTQPGDYVVAQDWNVLIDDPNVILVDTRNDYEIGIGSFAGAINPKTKSFRELPHWVTAFKESLPTDKPKPKIAMFCTGGIRCEKSTALLRAEGFEDVVHLKGGILKYLEEIPAADSRWQGECFVFDQRVSVGHGLALGSYDICHACRMPLSAAEKAHSSYEVGVACLHCIDTRDDNARARYAERQKQVKKAEAKGQPHLGARMD